MTREQQFGCLECGKYDEYGASMDPNQKMKGRSGGRCLKCFKVLSRVKVCPGKEPVPVNTEKDVSPVKKMERLADTKKQSLPPIVSFDRRLLSLPIPSKMKAFLLRIIFDDDGTGASSISARQIRSDTGLAFSTIAKYVSILERLAFVTIVRNYRYSYRIDYQRMLHLAETPSELAAEMERVGLKVTKKKLAPQVKRVRGNNGANLERLSDSAKRNSVTETRSNNGASCFDGNRENELPVEAGVPPKDNPTTPAASKTGENLERVSPASSPSGEDINYIYNKQQQQQNSESTHKDAAARHKTGPEGETKKNNRSKSGASFDIDLARGAFIGAYNSYCSRINRPPVNFRTNGKELGCIGTLLEKLKGNVGSFVQLLEMTKHDWFFTKNPVIPSLVLKRQIELENIVAAIINPANIETMEHFERVIMGAIPNESFKQIIILQAANLRQKYSVDEIKATISEAVHDTFWCKALTSLEVRRFDSAFEKLHDKVVQRLKEAAAAKSDPPRAEVERKPEPPPMTEAEKNNLTTGLADLKGKVIEGKLMEVHNG